MDTLPVELGRLIDDARAHGASQIDCAALERLLHRHAECIRPDLMSGDQLLHG